MRFRTTLTLACLGGAVFSATAQAQSAGDCPAPTFEQCTSNSLDAGDPNQGFWDSECGQAERQRWAAGGGDCSSYVSQQAAEATPGESRVVYLPPEARRNGNSIATSTSLPYSYESHYSEGLLGSYASLMQRGLILALRDGLDLLSLPNRQAWDANGLAVASCDEYVYEKYYDYSVFEDSVAVAAGDARKVFDLAYSPGNIGDRALKGEDLASKSRHTLHPLSWFGTYPKNVYFEYNGRYPMLQEGNAYPMDADLVARIAAAPRTAHDFVWHNTMAQALADQPDDLLYAMEEKQADFAKLLDLRKRIFNKWQGAFKRWADGVGMCAIEVPPGQFLPDPNIYINPADYVSLVDLYGNVNPAAEVDTPVVTKVIDASNVPLVEAPDVGVGVQPGIPDVGVQPGIPDVGVQPGVPVIVNPVVVNPVIVNPVIINPVVIGPIMVHHLAAHHAAVSPISVHALNAHALVANAPAFAANAPAFAANAPVAAAPLAAHALAAPGLNAGINNAALNNLGINPGPADDGDCTQLPDLVFDCSAGFAGGLAMVNDYGARVAKCLKVVDAQIEASLKEARDEGCLEPNGVTPCDWSPRMFVREVQGRTLDGKEESFHSCQRFTGGDFSPGGLIRKAQSAGISGEENMTKSTEHVDQFMKDLKQWATRQVFPQDPTTGKPIFGAKTADFSQIGNDTFGVKYSYDVGWKLSNLDSTHVRICAAEVDLNADFDIDASIFGLKQNLVASHSYLRTDDAANGKNVSYQASLEVLGMELLGQPKKNSVNIPMFGGEVKFPVLSENLVERRTLMEASAHFAIGPIPVTISAGAAGELGVELSLNGEMEYGCPRPTENPNGMSANNANPDVLRVGARGGARPYAALSAFATAAVDVVVASAGVRADLTLINLSVPFTVGVTANISPGSDPSVTAKTDMNLVLETLSGRISVFIDTLFGKVLDKTIFTWSGPKIVKPIVSDSWNMDLRAARWAVLF